MTSVLFPHWFVRWSCHVSVWDWKIKKELAAKKAAKEAAAAKDKGQGKEGEDVVIVLDENTPEGALDKYFTDDDNGGPGGKPERKTRKFKVCTLV